MNCDEAAANWQSSNMQGYACRIGGGRFEQAVERTSFMGTKCSGAVPCTYQGNASEIGIPVCSGPLWKDSNAGICEDM